MVKRMGTALNPKTLVYQSQKFKVRALRVIEAVETPRRRPPWRKACGELPGQFAGGYGAPHGTASGARPDRCGKCPGQRTHGHVGGCCRVGPDHIRDRRSSTDRWPGDRSTARALKIKMVYDAGRSGDEDFVPLRLIERNTAFSIKYAMTIIAMPTSRRSTCRMKGLVGIVFGGALFIIRVLSLERITIRNEKLAALHAGHPTLRSPEYPPSTCVHDE